MCQAAATGATCWGNYKDDIDIEVGKERALAIPANPSKPSLFQKEKKSAMGLKIRLLSFDLLRFMKAYQDSKSCLGCVQK